MALMTFDRPLVIVTMVSYGKVAWVTISAEKESELS